MDTKKIPDMDDQVQRYHPLHEHPLVRFKNTAHENEEEYCYACREVLDGLYFGCEEEDCKFWLHEWCLEKPIEISHPRHPQHHLTLYESDKGRRPICDECLCDPEQGFHYCCLHCGFMLHFQCAFLTINEPRRSQPIKESFRHVAHRHELILYNQVRDIYESPRFVRKRSETTKQNILIYCQWCTKAVLSGRTYACIGCELYFHQACAFMEVPFKIRHHSHKPHILRLGLTDYESLYDDDYDYDYDYDFDFEEEEDDDYDEEKTTCRACKRIGGLCYTCEECKWWIHGKCSTLLPSFKSEYHDHDLIYFEKEDYGGMDFSCHKCGGMDDSQNNNFDGFYRCIECDVNFHLSCILPDTVKHKYHWHSLTLMNSTKNDSDDQYYCDICETKRNPNYSVYACKECDCCVAHIECALNQERKNELQLLTKGPSVVFRYMEVRPDSSTATTAVKKWTNGANVEMRHPFHDHFLCLDTPRPYQMCGGCGKYFAGIAFMCKSCEDFALHERCAEFPLELLNFPLHSHHPPLVLKFLDYGQFSSPSFRCDVCGKVRDGFCFRYQCTQCNFFVDTKCAFLSTPTLSHQHKNIVAKHFSHQHQLHLLPCGAKEAARCRYCGSKIEGLAYRCMERACRFYLHESCIRQIPRQLKQLHFHPSHPLVFSENPTLWCNVCGVRLKCLGYDCSECGADISVHSVCALFQRRTLKSSHHDHVLYYFGRDINLLFKHLMESDCYSYDGVWFECKRCGGSCSRAFYRCLECAINFHLECIPIPRVVKSKCHRHPVNLVDSFVVEGYDLDDQYCDVCEEKRDSRDHAYYCDRCSDPFVGHVDCVLYKMVQIIEEAKRGPSNHCCNDLDSTDDERVFGNQRFMVRIEKEISFSSEKKKVYGTEFMDFHPTKPWLVTSDKINFVYIWSYEKEELQLEKSFKAKYSVSKFIERENWIVIGDDRGYIYVYNYETSKKIDKFRAHDFRVDCLAVHSSHSYLFSSGDRFVIRLWDWKKKKGTWLCIKEFVDHYPTRNRAYDSHVQVAFNPKDLNTFASIADDGNLMIWNINSSDPVCVQFHSEDENIRSIEFFMHGDKQYLLASFSSGLIKIWEYGHQDLTTTRLCLVPKLPIQVTYPGDDRLTVGIWIDAINYRCKLENDDVGYFTSFAWGECSKPMVLIWVQKTLMLKITTSREEVSEEDREMMKENIDNAVEDSAF